MVARKSGIYSRVVADVWEKAVWDFQAKSGSSGSCHLFLHFLWKIAVQNMSGKTPGSPRHPSSRHPRPSDIVLKRGLFSEFHLVVSVVLAVSGVKTNIPLPALRLGEPVRHLQEPRGRFGPETPTKNLQRNKRMLLDFLLGNRHTWVLLC